MTQTQTLLKALQRGEKLTVFRALKRYGVMALSQRMGDLKRAGHRVKAKMVRQRGKHFCEYSL